jgi:hypothetical protein
MSPGVYYVALTWQDADGNTLLANNTPFTVLDGVTPVFGSTINQENGPDSTSGVGASYLGNILVEDRTWQAYGFISITGPTVTVTISNTGAEGLILADGVLLFQVSGTPAGNSERGEGDGERLVLGEGSGGSSLRVDDSSDALDSTLLGTTYWGAEIEDMIELLAADNRREESYADDLAISKVKDDEELELALADWLE